MVTAEQLIAENIAIWSSAIQTKSAAGRGKANKQVLYGIKKLRELILELAVRGLLVPQDPNDKPASELLKKISAEKAGLLKDGKIKKPKALPSIDDDEVPFGLPDGWVWTRIAEIAQVGPRNEASDDAQVSFVPMPLITTNYDGGHGQEIREWLEVKKGYTHFADGDFAIAKITPCFENSKATIFSDLKNGIGAGTTELHVARPYGEFVNRRYVLLYLKAPQFLLVGEGKMTGTAGQKRVPKDFFALNLLPFPPLAEQNRIVAKVNELMVLCNQLEQQKETNITTHQTLVQTLLEALTTASERDGFTAAWARIADHFDTLFTTVWSIDQLKQTILQLAVMGKLVPQDSSDETASALIEQIVVERDWLIKDEGLRTKASIEIDNSEEYVGRPNGWDYCRLGNLAKFIDYRGRTPKKIETGVPLITAKNVRFGFISRGPEEYISADDYEKWMTRGFPRVGDLLFTTEAPLGNVALVNIEEKFALAQRVICFQFHDPGISPFLRALIMSVLFQEQLADKATGMTATGIKSARLKEIPVPLPPLKEQKRIVAKVDELMALCDTLKTRLNNAQATQLKLADAMAYQTVR